MTDSEPAKRAAARAAADLVESGMILGLGSGTTASLVVERLGERVREEGLRVSGVATSLATAELARRCGVPMVDLDDVPALDLDIDGADEVDPRFRMIKGRGGALLREKIVATASRRRVIVITPEKRVDPLGQRVPVPVEVSAFGWTHTERSLRDLGATTMLRRQPDGTPMTTDEGHRIIDCRFGPIDDPEALNHRLRRVPGVFETGLFLNLCDLLVIGHADGVDHVENPDSST